MFETTNQHVANPGSPGLTNGKPCPSSCSLIDLSSMSVFVRALARRELWHRFGGANSLRHHEIMKLVVTWKIIKAESMQKDFNPLFAQSVLYSLYLSLLL